MNKVILLAFCLLHLVLAVQAQEICDNAIDDDNDGLVDFNDTADCFLQ